MKTCLVTGASGQLGGAVMRRLRASHEVVGLGHRAAVPGLRSVDLRDAEGLRRLLEEVRPDLVVHCAAYRDPDFCESHPEETRRLNVDPLRVMVRSLSAEARLLFVSSDYVFEGSHPPYVEHDERRPVNVYGMSKVEGEDLLAARPNTIILRIPVLVGAGPDLGHSGFLSQMWRALKSPAPVELDDTVVRYPTWIEDVADVIEFLFEKQAEGVFHYTGEEGATRYGWTKKMAALLNIPSDHVKGVVVDASRSAPRPRDAHLGTDRIRALGYGRFTGFSRVMLDILDSFGVKPAG